jgi:hypothetical protein
MCAAVRWWTCHADFGDIPQFHILRCAERLSVLTILPRPPRGHMPMTAAEAERAARKCGQLGEALVDFYAGRAGGAPIYHLYQAWFDWVGALGPQAMQLVINDYSGFQPAHSDEHASILEAR